jgi:3-hydroxypropionate dehydrogenase (NADP+)
VLARITTTTSIEDAVGAADYVQESVFESYEVKKETFRKMDRTAPANTILATSSSGLLMTEIQKATMKPERCVIANPWNPPYLMPLVEVVPGEETSKETIEVTCELMQRVGQVPVVLRKEIPGFIGNRLQWALWREVIDLVDKGVASVEDVEKALYAGPGLRWAFMGANLTLHLGGGAGGLEYYINHIGQEATLTWKSMDAWTSIPYSGAKKVIEGIKQTEIVRTMNLEELKKWRDEKLMELLKVIYNKSRTSARAGT